MNSDQLNAWLDAAPVGVMVPHDIMSKALAFGYVAGDWRQWDDYRGWTKWREGE